MLILYIHGFLSSPKSHKALQVQAYCAGLNPVIEYQCPFLTAYPGDAIQQLDKIVQANRQANIGLIGSSMGGFYATYLSQRYNIPAVLINPAVKPYLLMDKYLGQPLANYHTHDTYQLEKKHVQELRDLETNSLQYLQKLWLMVQTGDETLDYRLAVEKYQGCKTTIEEGGDHSFQNFDQHLESIIHFLKTS